MNWWMTESPLETRAGREKLIEIMERELPECLPSSYGDSEPPVHKYDLCGKKHFIEFLDKNLEFLVWYPQRPITGVFLGLPSPPGPHIVGSRLVGFRMNHLSIRFQKEILDSVDWSVKLLKFWKNVSGSIRPVYGDVRNLGPHRWQGQMIGCLRGSQGVGWWWRGIPRRLGKAVVLGAIYQKHWPGFTSVAENIDGIAFASLQDWQSDGDLADRIGPPPENQASVLELPRSFGESRPAPKFPIGWPFGNPYPN